MPKRNFVYDEVEDTSGTLQRVEPRDVASALGAEEVVSGKGGGSPFSMAALRSRLLLDIVSTGGTAQALR